MKCISCGSLAKLIKEWNYHNNYYHVKLYECSTCQFTFKAYFHDEELNHTIPKYAGTAQKIVNFLRRQDFASSEEIAMALKLTHNDVITVLKKLEKEGLAEKALKQNK